MQAGSFALEKILSAKWKGFGLIVGYDSYKVKTEPKAIRDQQEQQPGWGL